MQLCAGSTETTLLRRTNLPRPSAFHAVRAHYQSLPLDRTSYLFISHLIPNHSNINLFSEDTPYADSLARAIVDEALGIERRSAGAHSWTAWIVRVILGRLGLVRVFALRTNLCLRPIIVQDSFLATRFGLEGVRRRQVEDSST
jgi:hypothetical protein